MQDPGQSRSKKRVFLHIGLHKTGTSTLQAWLRERSEVLARHGILYPETGRFRGGTGGAHHLLAIPGQPILQLHHRRPQGIDRARWRVLRQEIEDRGLPSTLISSEAFSRMTPETIEQVLVELEGFDVQVITFVRHPRSWIPSWYRQKVRTGQCLESLRQWVCHAALPLRPEWMIGNWERILGQDCVSVHSMEAAIERPGGVEQTLIEALGLGNNFQDFLPLMRRRNRTPDDDRVRLEAWLRATVPRPLVSLSVRAMNRWRGPLPEWARWLGRRALPDPLLSPADEAWIVAQFGRSFDVAVRKWCQDAP